MKTKNRKILRHFWLLPNKGGDVEIIWSTGEIEIFTIPSGITGGEFLQYLRRQ